MRYGVNLVLEALDSIVEEKPEGRNTVCRYTNYQEIRGDEFVSEPLNSREKAKLTPICIVGHVLYELGGNALLQRAIDGNGELGQVSTNPQPFLDMGFTNNAVKLMQDIQNVADTDQYDGTDPDVSYPLWKDAIAQGTKTFIRNNLEN